VIIRPASSQAQDRESSPVKDQRSTTVLRRQPPGASLVCVSGIASSEVLDECGSAVGCWNTLE